MRNLIKSEVLRFRGLALAFAGVHLLSLGALTTISELFSKDTVLFGGVVYSLSGLIFGLCQIGSYRHRHLWIYLLHRPLAPAKIFLSLGAAATVILTAVFVLPWLFAIMVSDLTNWQWVDWRHYLTVIFVLATLLTFYLIGCFIVLSPCRSACLLLVMPIFFFTREAVGWWVLVPLVVILLWTLYLAYSSFRPDLSAYPRCPLAVALAALPVQYVAFWSLHLIFLMIYSTVTAFAEQGWRSYALHSWNEYFAEDTFARVEYMSSEDALAHGLRHADVSVANPWRAGGIRVVDVIARRGRLSIKPQLRGQPIFMDRGSRWYDRLHDLRWTFSHDTMRFYGQVLSTGGVLGWLGPGGVAKKAVEDVEPFSQVPSFIEGRRVHTRQQIYDFDAERQRLDLRFEVTDDESLLTEWIDDESFNDRFNVVLSNRAVYILEPESLPESALKLPWRGDVRNLSRVLVTRSGDGFLVSLILGSLSERETFEARQTTVRLGADGVTEVLADEVLGHGPPAWTRHRGFIVSPLIQTLHDIAWSAIEPYSERHVGLKNVLKLPSAPWIWGLAFFLALVSAVLAAGVARRRRLDVSARRVWTAACFLIGFPALISLLFLTPRQSS